MAVPKTSVQEQSYFTVVKSEVWSTFKSLIVPDKLQAFEDKKSFEFFFKIAHTLCYGIGE